MSMYMTKEARKADHGSYERKKVKLKASKSRQRRRVQESLDDIKKMYNADSIEDEDVDVMHEAPGEQVSLYDLW